MEETNLICFYKIGCVCKHNLQEKYTKEPREIFNLQLLYAAMVIESGVLTGLSKGAFWCCMSLKEVYYTGNEEQWNAITNGGQNDSLYAATRYYYSETEPQGEGNYWHYVDGQIVKW